MLFIIIIISTLTRAYIIRVYDMIGYENYRIFMKASAVIFDCYLSNYFITHQASIAFIPIIYTGWFAQERKHSAHISNTK